MSSSPWKSPRPPVAPYVFAAAGIVAFLVVLDVAGALPDELWPVVHDADAARLVANALARASVALISTLLASLFLAIPLTANMYTPQLVELFARSWTNRIALGLFVASAAYSTWLTALVDAAEPPSALLAIGLVLVLATIAILMPFLFNVLRMLDPEEIIARVAGTVDDAMHVRHSGVVERHRLARRIRQLGNVALRSLERSDRDTALAAVHALGACATRYLDVKPSKPAEWFHVDGELFPGLSDEALELMRDETTWVEMELIGQLGRAYDSALRKAPDVVSAIGATARAFAAEATRRGHSGSFALTARYFNNFLREAIKRRDLHALYDLLFQIRQLAIGTWAADPAAVVEMARHLAYYGAMAARAGMPFAHDLVSYDLGAVVASAAQRERPELVPLVDAFLAAGDVRDELTAGVIKSRLLAAASLRAAEHPLLAEHVEASVRGAARDLLERASEDLLSEETPRSFWEVTDRQLNLDWVAPALRPVLRDVVERIGAARVAVR